MRCPTNRSGSIEVVMKNGIAPTLSVAGRAQPSVGIVDIHSDRLVEFELRWYLSGGGPPGQIMAEFALDPVEFFDRVLRRLEQDPPSPIRGDVIEGMKAVARRRLWILRR
jgi:hypothetical protein